NMVCFNSTGTVEWLRDYPNLKNVGLFTLIQAQNDLLLVTSQDQKNPDGYPSTGGFIKTDLSGNIKISAGPKATCYGNLIANPTSSAFPFEEVPTRVDDVVDAPEFKSSFYTPYERDVYFKAEQECSEISNCNFLSISGKDSICNISDTIIYNITRNIGCTSTAAWQADTAFVKIVAKTDTSLKVIFRKAGNTNIVASISSGCTVITKSFPVVSVISPATLNLGPDKAMCGSTSIILNAHAGFKSYQWQDGSVDSILKVKAPGVYYVKATNFCNVVLKDTITIASAIALPLSIGNDTSICINDSLMLTASPGFTSYSWSPAYNINTVTGITVKVWPAKDTAYTVAALQPNGCIVTDTIKMSINSVQPLSLGSDTSICKGTSLSLDAGAGFIKYQWNTGSASQKIIASNAGAYYVSAIDKNSCTTRDTLQIVNVFSLPVVHLGNDTSLCQGEVLPLNAGTGFKSYLWNTGAVTQSIVAANAGKYIVNVIDNNLCNAADTLSIISILSAVPIYLGADTMICQGERILLDAGTGFINYQWSTGETTQQIYVTQQGSYFVAAKNSNNCLSRDSFSLVRVNALPVINLDKDGSLCAGTSRLLDAGAGTSYLWQDGSTKNTFNATGVGKYWVRVINNANCTATDTTKITRLLPLPANFIYHDTAICEGLDITLMPGRQFENYLWSNGRTSSSLNITSAGQYWLQVMDASGCQAKEYINVISKSCVSALYFPNAFTPNNDGLNDVYKPTLFGVILKFHLVRYNRFGEKVFESYDVNRGWDGWFNNGKQNGSVFTWYSEYQFKNEPLKNQRGIVTLIR
ncbi:MAG: T9SS type B sorting domain-containing protein, partial [Ferruginibacter sp.]